MHRRTSRSAWTCVAVLAALLSLAASQDPGTGQCAGSTSPGEVCQQADAVPTGTASPRMISIFSDAARAGALKGLADQALVARISASPIAVSKFDYIDLLEKALDSNSLSTVIDYVIKYLPGSIAEAADCEVLQTVSRWMVKHLPDLKDTVASANATLEQLHSPTVLPVLGEALIETLPGMTWNYLKLFSAGTRLLMFDRYGWIEGRISTIKTLRSATTSLNEFAQSEITHARVDGALSIASGALGLLGLVAAPFTAGGSLALTAVSIGVGVGSGIDSAVSGIQTKNAANEVMQNVKAVMTPDLQLTAELEPLLGDVADAWQGLSNATTDVFLGVIKAYANMSADDWNAAAGNLTIGDVISHLAVVHTGLMDRLLGTLVGQSTFMDWFNLFLSANSGLDFLVNVRPVYLMYDAAKTVSARLYSVVYEEITLPGEVEGALWQLEASQAELTGIARDFGAADLPYKDWLVDEWDKVHGDESALALKGGLSKAAVALGAILDVVSIWSGINDLLANANPAANELHQEACKMEQSALKLGEEYKAICSCLAIFARETDPVTDNIHVPTAQNSFTGAPPAPGRASTLTSPPNGGIWDDPDSDTSTSPGGRKNPKNPGKLPPVQPREPVNYRRDRLAQHAFLSSDSAWDGSHQGNNLTSLGGYFTTVLGTDGNIVVSTKRGTPIWSSGTGPGADQGPFGVQVSGGGILCVMNHDGQSTVWCTPNPEIPGPSPDKTYLIMGDNGGLSVMQPAQNTSDPPYYLWELPFFTPNHRVVKNLEMANGKKVALLCEYEMRIGAYDGDKRGTKLVATKPWTKEWETFRADVQPDGTVAFFNLWSKWYMTGTPDGRMLLWGESASDWEKFIVEFTEDGHIHLKSWAHQKYVTCEWGGNDVVTVNRDAASEWETLTFVLAE